MQTVEAGANTAPSEVTLVLVVDQDETVVLAEGSAWQWMGEDPGRMAGRPASRALPVSASFLLAGLRAAMAGRAGAAAASVAGRELDVRYEPRMRRGTPAGATVVAVQRRGNGVANAEPGRVESSAEQLERYRGEREHLMLLLTQIPGAVWATDRALRITHAVGRERGELVPSELSGRTVPEYVGSSDPNEPAVANHRAALQGQTCSFRYERRGRSYDVSLRPLRNDAGEVIGTVGVALDTTEQWAASRELQDSLSLLRATLESTADGILVVDREQVIRAYNQRFLALWRLPPELVVNGRDERALHVVLEQLEDGDAFLQRVRDLYAQPDAESFDVIRFRDGRIYERYSQPQRVGSEVVGRVWSFRDVTDRELLLRRAMFLADASRLLASLDVEPALEAVARLAMPYVGDACAVDLVSDEGGPRRLLALAQDGSQPTLGEIPPAVLAGHAVMYTSGGRAVIAVPLWARGRTIGVLTFRAREGRRYGPPDLALVEELSRRVELSLENARLFRRAEEALRARDEFLAIAAHEIRGPVTSLHLATQALQRGKLAPAPLARALEIIEREDHRLARFVDALLDVTHIRSGDLHFDFEDVDLGEVVRAVVARLGPEIAASGSALSVTVTGRVVGTWDRMRVDQVATNLIANAIKFGLGRPIEVEAGRTGDEATLRVTDHGLGIAPERQRELFQAFGRAVSSRHYGGLGLGLYIVRTIATGLGGSVELRSEPGRGSTFTVKLPLARPGVDR